MTPRSPQPGLPLQGPPAEVFAREGDLARLRLEPPDVVRLGRALAASGLPVPREVLTVYQLVQALAP